MVDTCEFYGSSFIKTIATILAHNLCKRKSNDEIVGLIKRQSVVDRDSLELNAFISFAANYR